MRKSCLLGISTVLSGCVLFAPSPAVEAIQAAGALASGAVSLVPASTPETQVVHLHEKIPSVCIELNQSTAVPDFVPALQAALLDNNVRSRVYPAGALVADCRATVDYVGYMDWARKLFSDNYSPYLTSAVITLRQDGKVLASVSYRLGDSGIGKWASSYDKIKTAVRALLVNN